LIQRLRRLFEQQQADEETQPMQPAYQPTDPAVRIEHQIAASHNILIEAIMAIEQEVSRIAKEQHKTNTQNENVIREARAAISLARSALNRPQVSDRPSQIRPPGSVAAASSAGATSDTRLIEALMPILDRIEAALESGSIQMAAIEDREAREILRGWLEGQRLIRERLLALFEKESIRPITTVGQVFDPYRHVAVETMYDPSRPIGTIVEERRRGYEFGTGSAQRVLRFAEVVVTKPG
jgi:hypothetical protein